MSLKTFAVAKKELKLHLRYPWNYFGQALLQPAKFIILFIVVYSAFFTYTSEIGNLTKENFVLFLVLGSLVHTFFNQAISTFSIGFINEKYWETIDSFLVAPVKKINLLLGVGLAEFFRLIIVSLLFFIVAYLLIPISFLTFLLVLLIIVLLFIGTLGFGIIKGVFALSNENYLFVFDYFAYAWMFLSCFYYPIEILPSWLQNLVLINPVYHGLTLIRSLWFGGSFNLFSFLFVLNFAFILPLIGVLLFNKIWKRLGVHGY